MTNVPLVSVILPTYNRIKHINNSIASVLGQDTKYTIELIIVDDASTDGTENEINKINDQRVKYIKLNQNSGGGKARNVGINSASGKYIAFIDSDTIWYKNKIQIQVELLEKNQSYIGCYSRFTKLYSAGSEVQPPQIPAPDQARPGILLDNYIDTPTSIVKREVLERVGGFDENLPRFQDWEMFIRLTKLGMMYGFYQPLIDSLDLSDSISRNDKARLTALKIIYQKHYEEINESSAAINKITLKLFMAHALANDRSNAMTTLMTQFKKVSFGTKLVCLAIIATPNMIIRKIK